MTDPYLKLRKFLEEDMAMAHVYQPVMIRELLTRSGTASVRQIAQAILDRDPTQIEYFSEIVKNMVGRVLTKNRGITKRQGEHYHLLGSEKLTLDECQALVLLCEQKIAEF